MSGTVSLLIFEVIVTPPVLPFDRLVYCLLGRCDLADAHTEVAQSIDDFLWLRLSQISIRGSVVITADHEDVESLTLGQLQTLLFDTYGERHTIKVISN